MANTDFDPGAFGLVPDSASAAAAATHPSGFDPKAFGLTPTSEAPKKAPDAPVSVGRVAAQAAAGATVGVLGGIPDAAASLLNRSPFMTALKAGVTVLGNHSGVATPGMANLPEGAVTHAIDTGLQETGVGPGAPQNAPERIARGAGTGAIMGLPAGPMGAVTGAVAGGAGAAAEELPGIPAEWKPAAGFLGSLLGGGVASALTSAPRAIAEATVLPKTFAGPGVQADAAASRFAGLADDPAAARAALAAPPAVGTPATPTTAQAAHDAGFAAATNALRGDAAVTRDANANAQALARADALRAATPTGDPAALPTGLRAEQTAGNAAAGGLVDEATRTAQAQAARLPAAQTPEALGTTQRAAITTQHEALRAHENTAWDAVRDLDLEVPGAAVRNVIENQYRDLSPAVRLRPEENAIRQLMTRDAEAGGFGGAETLQLRDMTALRTRVGEATAQLRGAGYNQAAGRMDQIYRGLQNTIETAAGAGTPEAQTIAAATAATRARTGFAAQPQNEAALGRDRGGGPTTPASALPKTVFEAGATGAETAQRFRAAVGEAAAVPILHDNAANALLGMRGALRADGTIDPGVLAQFQQRYGNALRGIPGAEALYGDVGAASRAVADAEAVRREAASAYETGAAGALLGVHDAGQVTARVGRVLAGVDAPAQFADLAAKARQAGPTATAGLRRATVESILATYVNPATGTLKEGASGFLGFLARPQTAGALAQVLEPAEIANLRGIAAQIERESTLQLAAGQRPGILRTEAPKATMAGVASLAKKVPVWTLGGLAGHFTGVPGAELAGASVANGIDSFVRNVRARGIANINQMVEEALLDPVAGRLLLDAARNPTPSAWSRFVRRMGMPTLGTAAVLGNIPTQGPDR